MKTSNKLLIAAFVLILVSLFFYDKMLKTEYLTGKYKDPYKSYTVLKFRDFDTVNMVSSTAINVKFVQGPFKVTIDPDAADYARVVQHGNTLTITASYLHNYLYNKNPYLAVISCPKISAIYANATYSANNKPFTDTVNREDWNIRGSLLEGFRQDSLIIRQNYGSGVTLVGNNLGYLDAVIGIKPGSGSKLEILQNNIIQRASINVNNSSLVLLKSAGIKNLTYHLADSARMTLSAATQNLLINPSNPTKK